MRNRGLAIRSNLLVMLRLLQNNTNNDHHRQDNRGSHKRILCDDDAKLAGRGNIDNLETVCSPGNADPGGVPGTQPKLHEDNTGQEPNSHQPASWDVARA